MYPSKTIHNPTDPIIGPQKGVVEDVIDDAHLHRYKVRCPRAYASDTPVDHLPWAEYAAPFASKDAGDMPVLQVGDIVWLMFEDGDRNRPVIIGSSLTLSNGIPDGSAHVANDYANTRKRWRRQDRVGNAVELSEHPDELHVRIVSGDATITLTKRDGGVTMTTSGPVTIEGNKLLASVLKAVVDAGSIRMSATQRTNNQPTGKAAITANKEVILNVPKTANAAGRIRIGQEIDEAAVPTYQDQTSLVQLLGETIELGVLDDPTILQTLIARIQVVQTLLLKSQTDITIEAGQKLKITAANVEVTANTSMSLTGQSQVKIESPVDVQIKSNTKISIIAPSVNVSPS